IELCSLVFHYDDPSPTQLVAASIFGDGAAAAVVVPEDRGINIVATQSLLIPNTRHMMGYDILDDGFHLRLDRALPQTLAEYAPIAITDFLKSHSLALKDIDYWLFHPGGVRILDLLDKTFNLG